MKELHLDLPEKILATLNDVAKDKNSSVPRYLFKEVIRGNAINWLNMVDRLEIDGYLEFNYDATREREAMTRRLEAEDFRFDAYTIPEGPGNVSVKMPEDLLVSLTKGAAIQDKWNELLGAKPKDRYATFPEWINHVVKEQVLRDYAALHLRRLAPEIEEVYPGLDHTEDDMPRTRKPATVLRT